MFTVTIDMGSYSIKVLESKVDKKRPKHVNQIEIPLKLSEKKVDLSEEDDLIKVLPYFDAQIEALKIYLSKIPDNAKIVFQSPIEMTSTRFTEVPVKQKKKAEQMVPFQLEENIPFQIQDVHLASNLKKSPSGFDSVSSYVPNIIFEKYWKALKEQDALPTYLTTELSTWTQYVQNTEELASETTTCILDIGHRKTVAYFIQNGKVLAYNLCFIGGANINEMIMTHYDVDEEKAIEFKHNNSFFLLKEQYHEVDERQREFATKMDEAMQPLIREYKRWELSFRVNHGLTVNKVYLTGGSSHIKNIENYLTGAFGVKVSFLDDFTRNFSAVGSKRANFLSFGNANALSYFYPFRQMCHNFLTGIFAPLRSEEIPIYSLSFISLRTVTLTLFICGALFLEGFFLKKRDKEITKSIKSTLSRPNLGIPSRDIKVNIKKKPKVILSKIQRKLKTLNKEIKEISKNQRSKGLKGLFMLTEKVQSECYLSDYKDLSTGEVVAKFASCEAEELDNLETSIKGAGFKKLEIKANKNSGKLDMSFKL